jgi:hypothetical protein
MEMVEYQIKPLMETVEFHIETDATKISDQPNSEVLPFIETVWIGHQRLHIELGNSEAKVEILNQELAEARSQLKTEHADQERIGAELSPVTEKFCSGRHTF